MCDSNSIDAKLIDSELKHNIFPPFATKAGIEFLLDYKTYDFGHILSTYNKCGTHWANQIINLLIDWRRTGVQSRQSLKKFFLEVNGQQILENIRTERLERESDEEIVLTTHLSYEFLPLNECTKYLIVLRNPKDVVVSNYYHGGYCERAGIDFHQFFKHWISGELFHGDHFVYVKKYWQNCKPKKNFTFLVYEEMKRDIKSSIKTIAQFLGQKYVNRLANNDQIMAQIIEKSSFVSMKKYGGNENHYRKGVVGDWRSHLTKHESDLIDKRVEEEWMGTGLELLWKEEMKWILNN